MHESKKDFQNVNTRSLFEIYRSNTMKILQKDFISGDYSRYKMCEVCSDEMGFYKNKTSNPVPDIKYIISSIKNSGK